MDIAKRFEKCKLTSKFTQFNDREIKLLDQFKIHLMTYPTTFPRQVISLLLRVTIYQQNIRSSKTTFKFKSNLKTRQTRALLIE